MKDELIPITIGYMIGSAISIPTAYFLMRWEGVGVVVGLHFVVLIILSYTINSPEE